MQIINWHNRCLHMHQLELHLILIMNSYEIKANIYELKNTFELPWAIR